MEHAAYAALRRPARKVSTLVNSAVACWLSSPDATMTLSARARDWSAAWLAPGRNKKADRQVLYGERGSPDGCTLADAQDPGLRTKAITEERT